MIEFVATEGTRAGLRASGKLILVRTSTDDRSPVTGERASDENIARVPFYGALVVDLAALGAPVNCGGHYPQIESLDPVRPGVLVETIPDESRARTFVTDSMLWVGSGKNIRRHVPNTFRIDEGCGVLMTIAGGAREVVTGNLRETIAGTWSEAGLARNGRGTWTARLLQPLP